MSVYTPIAKEEVIVVYLPYTHSFGVRINLGTMIDRSKFDLYESHISKSHRADYRIERMFYFSHATKHASRISKDRYKIRESIENRYEAHLRPEDQPPLPSNLILKNKNTKTENEKDTKPFAEERSNYHLRTDDSEATVKLEAQQSPSGILKSRNPSLANASNASCADLNPFRQVNGNLNPFRKGGDDLNPFRQPTSKQSLEEKSIAEKYRNLFEKRVKTVLTRSAEGSTNIKISEGETYEYIINNLRLENIKLKADIQQLESKLKDVTFCATGLGKMMTMIEKQSQEKMEGMTTLLEGLSEKIILLKNTSKPKKNKWLKIFSRKKKDRKDQ